ncbi:hypothetical protein ACIQM4_04845 [Streptomyces sp. NPDC091272]|uniref:hypothetical protein n=1 Tax=Streptomyces sp. NPDC091272 TaxID=3365981 RepID=UPI00380E4D30
MDNHHTTPRRLGAADRTQLAAFAYALTPLALGTRPALIGWDEAPPDDVRHPHHRGERVHAGPR